MPDLTTSQQMLAQISAKKEKFAKIPPEMRPAILERIFDRYIAPGLPKAISEKQRGDIKDNYGAFLFGSPTIGNDKPTREDYSKAGMATGKMGKVEEGIGQGLLNIKSLNDKIADFFHIPHSTPPRVQKLKEGVEAHKKATEEYSQQHPDMSNFMEFTGRQVAAYPFTYGMGATRLPGAAKGTPFAARLGINALRGGTIGAVEGPIAFDPTGQHPLQGAAEGAAWGAGGSAVGTGIGAGLRRLSGKGSKVIEATTKAASIPGAAASEGKSLNSVFQEMFPGKDWGKLTSDQKAEVVRKWHGEAVAKEQASRATAKTEKAASKISETKATAMAKAEARIQAMDEAKRYQRLITEFFRNNKKAPSQTEMNTLKARAAAGEDAAVAKPKAKAAAVSATPVPRTVTTPTPTPAPKATDISDMRKAVLPELKKQLSSVTSPEERKILEGQIAHMEAPIPQAFKTENPDIVKAVSAVADVSKIANGPVVQKIPEGVHGAGQIGQRAKDAERVAASRAEAKAAQPEPEAGGTPETALLDKEEQYLQKIEELEALGPKGKEAAKNLNNFTKGKKKILTTDQAMEMADKVLAKLKETK